MKQEDTYLMEQLCFNCLCLPSRTRNETYQVRAQSEKSSEDAGSGTKGMGMGKRKIRKLLFSRKIAQFLMVVCSVKVSITAKTFSNCPRVEF